MAAEARLADKISLIHFDMIRSHTIYYQKRRTKEDDVERHQDAAASLNTALMLPLAEHAQLIPCKMSAYYKIYGLLGLGKEHIGVGCREAPRCLLPQHGLKDSF